MQIGDARQPKQANEPGNVRLASLSCLQIFHTLNSKEREIFTDNALVGLIAWAQGINPRRRFENYSKNSNYSSALKKLFRSFSQFTDAEYSTFCNSLIESNK